MQLNKFLAGLSIGALALSLDCPIFATPTPEEESSSAIQAGDDYRALFKQYTELQDSLEFDDHELRYPEESEATPEEIAREQQRYQEGLSTIFEQVQALQAVSTVDWGLSPDDGPKAYFDHPHLGSIGMLRASNWYAQQTWEKNPDQALNAIYSSLTTGKHLNQQPTLVSYLIQNAVCGINWSTLAEFAPEMTAEQRTRTLQTINQLPETGTLAEALQNERDVYATWYRTRLLDALHEWENGQLGSDGFHFPNDLRLAGLVWLPNKPVRISLENTRTQQSFWLEQGKTAHGIQIEKVDRDARKAWIRKGDQTAVIDLAEQSIQNRTVPWEVIVQVFADDWVGVTNGTPEEIRKALAGMGFTPNNVLDELDRLHRYYTEAALQIDALSIEDYAAWEEAQLASFGEDSFAGIIACQVSKVVQVRENYQHRQQALTDGLILLETVDGATINDGTLKSNGQDYQIERTEQGFWLIPEAVAKRDDYQDASIHFGTPPPEEATN